MHCPNCGKPATDAQQFCRACGMGLETIGKLVAKHTGSPAPIQTKLEKSEAEKAIARSMLNWMTWGMLLVGIGVVMFVINKSFPIGKWFTVLSSFLAIAGMGVATGGVLNALRRGMMPRSHPTQLSNPPDTKSLPTDPILAELPSVTERTTQLIAVEEAPTNKMMDTGPNE
jgi:zinc ribbon protein